MNTRSLGLPSAVLGLLLQVSGCSSAETETGTVFADSAGVRVASAESPVWGADEGWIVEPEPLVEIGSIDGDGPYLLSQVAGAVRLSDGRIVVADGGSEELRYFDSDGTFLKRVGRRAEGPGEFMSLAYVGKMRGDSVVTYDSRLQRLQVFDPDGVYARSLALAMPWPTAVPYQAVGMVSGDRLVMLYIEYTTEVPVGIARWPHDRLVTVDLNDGAIDSLALYPGAETDVERRADGGSSQGRYIFSKYGEFATGGGRIAAIATDTFRINVSDVRGTPDLVIQRAVALEPANAAHQREYVAGVVDLVFPPGSDAGTDQMDRFRQSWLTAPMAPTLPLLRSIEMDTQGNVWLEPFFMVGTPPPAFEVFSPDGTWLGNVTLPAGLDRGFHPVQAPELEIGDDYVLGVWKDELGVEYVRMYGISKE